MATICVKLFIRSVGVKLGKIPQNTDVRACMGPSVLRQINSIKHNVINTIIRDWDRKFKMKQKNQFHITPTIEPLPFNSGMTDHLAVSATQTAPTHVHKDTLSLKIKHVSSQ